MNLDSMPISTILTVVGCIALAIFGIKIFHWMFSLRRVVPTNEVHIIQTSKKTISYGKDTLDGVGNSYYEWPSWIPKIGITKIILPVSVFDLNLNNYEAYDKDRLPFVVDIKSFFRINDSNTAASRVHSFGELVEQLTGIVQGAVRSIMANSQLDEIMSERSKYGQRFTEEVEEQLKAWGVTPVKNIELMDIRDHTGSVVIQNIMAKKQSHIEMESRVAVAQNIQAAETAEITAQQQVDIQKQEAEQTVGLRKAQTAKQIGVANQQASQEVQEQARMTKEKEMAVLQVQTVQAAEITKQSQIIQAEQQKQTTILGAEGYLEAKKKEAEGITVEGIAKAEAEKAMQLAPVQAQITLAKEIGDNQGYQDYLVTIRKVEATQAVGIEQARNLSHAEIKIIANSGDVQGGVSSVMDLFTAKGGTNIGAALEALANTDKGKEMLDKFTKPKEGK